MDARRMDEGTHEGTETMDSSTKGKVPRYMLPSFTSILPDYANSEADKIRQVTLLRPPVTPPLRLTPRPHRRVQSFQTGNFDAISKMPNQLA
jgi:hypothetical protein